MTMKASAQRVHSYTHTLSDYLPTDLVIKGRPHVRVIPVYKKKLSI